MIRKQSKCGQKGKKLNNFFDPKKTPIKYEPKIYNRKSLDSKYLKGKEVYIKNFNQKALKEEYIGPYKICEVGNKGQWIKVDGRNDWTHVKNTKL